MSQQVSPRPAGMEVSDIFREYSLAYRKTQTLPIYHLKVIGAIEQCRTAALGGHKDKCDECGHISISYNSCRNRHCPKCQGLAREKWILSRERDLLPIEYFHVVFTLPDDLNPMALVNQRVIYNLLFKAASETLLELGKDPKHLGGEIGFIAVLHTWGQNLMDHPHLHCIVTGGGLSEDGKRWILPRKHKSKKRFFIHVNVISELFKHKFLYYLQVAYHNNKLDFFGKIRFLASKRQFRLFINTLYDKRWVSYCKEPFGGPQQVFHYLGSYTHRVAISNHRIIKIENGKVLFRYRDYHDGNKIKVMSLDAFEFIRRFLLHILPRGFIKIRHYGLLSNRLRRVKLDHCREVLGVPAYKEPEETCKGWQDDLLEFTGVDLSICPMCGKGRMIKIEDIRPMSHSPPRINSFAA